MGLIWLLINGPDEAIDQRLRINDFIDHPPLLLDLLLDVLKRDRVGDQVIIVFDELPIDGIVEGPTALHGTGGFDR